jgi:hypothetical protein
MQKAKIEKVDPPNPLISRLAEFQWKEMEVMPAGAYAIYAGPATPQFARATAHAIQKNFRIDFQPQETQNPPGSMAAYGVLVRNLRHPDPPGKRFGTFWGFWRGGSDQLVEEAVAGFGVAEPGAVEILQ